MENSYLIGLTKRRFTEERKFKERVGGGLAKAAPPLPPYAILARENAVLTSS